MSEFVNLRADEQNELTDYSSYDDKVNFPFLTTPSGNLKVGPQQVVYESKQLSIVAANPRRTKVNIKANNIPRDMSGIEKKPFGGLMSPDVFNTPRHPMFRKPPYHHQADGDSPSDDQDLFMDHHVHADRKQAGASTVPQQLPHEVTLTKMGFNQEQAIDWSTIDLPPKTDLHKLLHYRISNYINPDVLVKISNHEYRCHMLVLQCYSMFFVEKSCTAVQRVELSENYVTKAAFAYIYDWMLHLGADSYTLLRRDNILEIFMAAQYLQVKELEEQCWAFIDNEELFSEDKAFMLYLDARRMSNTAVMELMVPRIQRFFLTLVASKDFLDLLEEEVSVFLRSNYICIHCEMEVFMAGVRWLMYDWEKRQKSLVNIMSCVRFGLIAPWQLVDIRRNPENQEFLMVTRDHTVSTMIEDGLAFAILKFWHKSDTNEYGNCVEALGLTEPQTRNWAGTQKKYTTYQDFLSDLNRYRQMHMLANKGNGDRGSCESLQSELEHARRAAGNNADLIMPLQRQA